MRLGYIILYVPDVAAAVTFYERAFAIERRFVHESGQFAEMETGQTALTFVSEDLAEATCGAFTANRPTGSPAGIEVAFVTDDVAGAFERAVAAGAVATVTPVRKSWGQTVAYVRDLNGCLVEICSPMG